MSDTERQLSWLATDPLSILSWLLKSTLYLVEDRGPSYAVGGNVNWYRHNVEQYGGTWKN